MTGVYVEWPDELAICTGFEWDAVSLAVAPGLDVLLLGDLVVPLVMAGFLGGGTGYASIKLARRALPASEAEVDELSSGSDSLLPDRGRAV